MHTKCALPNPIRDHIIPKRLKCSNSDTKGVLEQEWEALGLSKLVECKLVQCLKMFRDSSLRVSGSSVQHEDCRSCLVPMAHAPSLSRRTLGCETSGCLGFRVRA